MRYQDTPLGKAMEIAIKINMPNSEEGISEEEMSEESEEVNEKTNSRWRRWLLR